MASPGRILVLALCAGLALLGLALGAESQRESVLESDLQAQGELAAGQASGNLIALTAFLTALGVSIGAVLLSRRPPAQRLLPGAALGVAVYGGVLFAQTMWPSYVAVLESRYAQLTNSLLVANLDAVPSLLAGPLALGVAAMLVAGWAAHRLLSDGPLDRPHAPRDLLRAQAAATLLAAPFLAVAAWGNLRLLLRLPDDQPGLGPYFVVLPVASLACLALAGIAVVKSWHLGTFVRNARLAAAVQETWQTLGRVEGALVALLAALALAGTFLPAADLADLHVGRVLAATLRSHTQLLVMLAVPLVPLLGAHRATARAFEDAPLHPATLDDDTDPLAWLTGGAVVASIALAGIATWAIGPALWAWILALVPAAAVAATRCGARLSAPHVLLVAFLLWAVGNTVEATYDGSEGNGTLSFATPPGVLALARTVGALLAAIAAGRLARRLGDDRASRLPLAAGAGLGLGAVALLEMPLTAWLSTRTGIDAISVGSVVASLDAPVRAIVHTVATVLAVATAVLVALLHRADWFARRPRKPVATVRVKGQRASAPA